MNMLMHLSKQVSIGVSSAQHAVAAGGTLGTTADKWLRSRRPDGLPKITWRADAAIIFARIPEPCP
jgi:hypothetical protein